MSTDTSGDIPTTPEAVSVEPTQAAETPQAIESQPIEQPTETSALSIRDLKPKMELTGTVKRIELYGAFIDVGVERDGLLHISQIQEEPVKNVNDHLQVGQEITVYVRNIDMGRERIDLTMLKPLGVMWNEIQVGQVLTGTVVRVEKFGAFIEVGAERPGMIHVSELSSGYVGAPGDVVKVGDEVQAKVIKVNSRKKQIDLSIKALETPVAQATAEANEDDDKVPTAMELALRRAMQATQENEFPALEKALKSADTGSTRKSNKGKKQQDKRGGQEKRRQEQEELLSRTLKTGSQGRGSAAG